MAYLFEDRIFELSTSTGSGDIALAGAVTGYRQFSAVLAIGDTFPYLIEAVDVNGKPTGEYEYGLGTYSAVNTLTRTTVRGSSNAGAAVNFSVGTKFVQLSIQAPASAAAKAEWRAVVGAGAGTGNNTDITSLGNNTSTIYTTGGTSTAYTITPVPAYAAYAIGMSVMVNFNAACGASPTIAWNGIASPPQLVKENADGTYSNLLAGDIPINHRSRVTLISTTQALVERMASSGGITIGTAAATTSGTSVTVTGLPATMKRLTYGLKAVSISGTANLLLQFGVSGSLVTSGYAATVAALQTATPGLGGSTAGFIINFGSFTGPASLMSGQAILTSMGGNDWAYSANLMRDDNTTVFVSAGKISLSGVPDRIAIVTSNGTDTFDAGSINIVTES